MIKYSLNDLHKIDAWIREKANDSPDEKFIAEFEEFWPDEVDYPNIILFIMKKPKLCKKILAEREL